MISGTRHGNKVICYVSRMGVVDDKGSRHRAPSHASHAGGWVPALFAGSGS